MQSTQAVRDCPWVPMRSNSFLDDCSCVLRQPRSYCSAFIARACWLLPREGTASGQPPWLSGLKASMKGCTTSSFVRPLVPSVLFPSMVVKRQLTEQSEVELFASAPVKLSSQRPKRKDLFRFGCPALGFHTPYQVVADAPHAFQQEGFFLRKAPVTRPSAHDALIMRRPFRGLFACRRHQQSTPVLSPVLHSETACVEYQLPSARHARPPIHSS